MIVIYFFEFKKLSIFDIVDQHNNSLSKDGTSRPSSMLITQQTSKNQCVGVNISDELRNHVHSRSSSKKIVIYIIVEI